MRWYDDFVFYTMTLKEIALPGGGQHFQAYSAKSLLIVLVTTSIADNIVNPTFQTLNMIITMFQHNNIFLKPLETDCQECSLNRVRC